MRLGRVPMAAPNQGVLPGRIAKPSSRVNSRSSSRIWSARSGVISSGAASRALTRAAPPAPSGFGRHQLLRVRVARDGGY